MQDKHSEWVTTTFSLFDRWIGRHFSAGSLNETFN